MTLVLKLTPEQELRLARYAAQSNTDTQTLFEKWVDTLPADTETPAEAPQRVAGLFAGQIWTSDDFDAPLPDSFWFPEDEDGENAPN